MPEHSESFTDDANQNNTLPSGSHNLYKTNTADEETKYRSHNHSPEQSTSRERDRAARQNLP